MGNCCKKSKEDKTKLLIEYKTRPKIYKQEYEQVDSLNIYLAGLNDALDVLNHKKHHITIDTVKYACIEIAQLKELDVNNLTDNDSYILFIKNEIATTIEQIHIICTVERNGC